MLHRIKSGDEMAGILKIVAERLLLTSLDPRWTKMTPRDAERAAVEALRRCAVELRPRRARM
jgi:hypothetical protein